MQIGEGLGEGGTVVEVHLGERVVDFDKDLTKLPVVHVLRYDRQNSAQLLILLLKSQLLVHVGDPLLQSGLES